MIEIGEALPLDQSEKKQALGDALMTGKMTGLKKGIHLVVFLPQLFQERENEMVRKRKHLGELRKIGSPFVVLRMKLMKMDGPQYDVKSQDDGVKLVVCIGLLTFKDYYTCALTSLN